MNHRFLFIDAGNTFLKAAIYEEGLAQTFWKFEKPDWPKAITVLRSAGFEAVLISNNATDDREFDGWFEGRPVYFLNSTQYPGIRWAYQHPGTLGKDRLAALIGAAELLPGKNICVADAGTCLTLDFLSKDGVHLGGIISPGLKMRFSAMHFYTGKLPLISEKEYVAEIGKSTESCMAAGAVMGMVAEMEYHFYQQSAGLSDGMELLLTGGDAIFLAHRLKPANFVVADIVFQGMNAVLTRLV